MSSPSRNFPDLWLHRGFCLAGMLLYPLWGLLCSYLIPGSYNDMPGRLGVAALFLICGLATFASASVARRAEDWVAVACAILVLHYEHIVQANGGSAFYVTGVFVTLGAIDAYFQKPRTLLAFSLVAILGALPIAFGRQDPDPLGMVLLCGLAMQQGLFALGLQARQVLARKLEQADASVRALSSSLDATFDGVYLLEPSDGNIVYANQGAALQSGVTRDELPNRPVATVLPALTPEALARLVVALRAGSGPSVLVEAGYELPDGTRTDAEVLLQLVQAPGSGERLVAVVRDTTARKRLERELQARNTQLTELDRMKDELIGAVSHELRTPLGVIVGYTELIEEVAAPVLAPAPLGYLEHVREAAFRLQFQIEDLIDVARLAGGAMRIEPTRSEVEPLLSNALASVALQARRKGVHLELVPADDLPAVLADGWRVEQVAQNLLSNAIKFTPAGGDVRLSASQVEGAVRIEVHDTGAGIEPAEHALVFEKFYQTRSGAATKLGGAGLGLAIARGIVEAHGGQIGLESQVGAGSTFWFTLPFAPDG